VSIADHNRKSASYDFTKGRHPLCIKFEEFLDAMIADQDTGVSDCAEALTYEYGVSLTAAVGRAAGIRRVAIKHAKKATVDENPESEGGKNVA
jgi:hypothetical protein